MKSKKEEDAKSTESFREQVREHNEREQPYNHADHNRKIVKSTVSEEVSQWHTIKAKCEAERYPGSPLLDTNVELEIPRFAITWEDKEKFMQELAELLRKYQI